MICPKRCHSHAAVQSATCVTPTFPCRSESWRPPVLTNGAVHSRRCLVPPRPRGVRVLQRSGTAAGAQGRTFEDLLHLVVVILIQTGYLVGLSGTLRLSVSITDAVRGRASLPPGHCRSTAAAAANRCGVCIQASDIVPEAGRLREPGRRGCGKLP